MVKLRAASCIACVAALSSLASYSQTASPSGNGLLSTYEVGGKAQVLAEGLAAYDSRDYANATILLREALAGGGGNSDVHYMLIMSEMYGEDYASVIGDCDAFATAYPDSPLIPNVQYQKGKALHYRGDNDQAVMVLSDFCHENPKSPVYPSALYWIAECFYEDYNFPMAEGLFQRIIDVYPDDRKAVDAKYKIDAIAQREREQKLLDMLKANNERFLEQKASYERQLKGLEGADVATLKKELAAANARIAELERILAQEKAAAEADRASASAAMAEVVAARDAEAAAKAETAAAKDAAATYKAESDAARAEAAAYKNEAEAARAEAAAYRNEAEAARAEAAALQAKAAEAPVPVQVEQSFAAEPVQAARTGGVTEQELLELKLRAAQLQRLLDEKYSASRENKAE